VTMDQVKAIYEKQVGAGSAELAVVGDFDPDATLAAVRDILKDWKSDVEYKRIERTAPTDVAGSHEDIVTPDKQNAPIRGRRHLPAQGKATRTSLPCASAISCSAATRCRRDWAIAFARRKDFPMALPRRSTLRRATRLPPSR